MTRTWPLESQEELLRLARGRVDLPAGDLRLKCRPGTEVL
jgi:hypothetical protein